MASLTEVLLVARTTRNAFNYWRRAGLLSSRFKKTKPGVASDLTRANALEVAFMAAAVATGLSPKLSKAVVKQWLEAEATGNLPSLAVHIQHGLGVGTHLAVMGIEDDEIDIVELSYRLGATLEEGWSDHWREQAEFGTYVTTEEITPAPSATAFAVIRLSEIVRRIDQVFAKAGSR